MDLQGAASACVSNPTCRGFQICWSFPISSGYYYQNAVIRLKAGPQAPLNISAALQNPYCSIYVLRSGAASAPNSGTGGYSLSQASNASAIASAAASLNQGSGRRLSQASGEASHRSLCFSSSSSLLLACFNCMLFALTIQWHLISRWEGIRKSYQTWKSLAHQIQLRCRRHL